MARSLNKVILIGNLTRDPELRFTPQGTAVCTFGLATNRQWATESGEKKEDVEFHRIVAWSKLAEICGQLLAKGRKVYVEGRLQTRSWTGQDGAQRTSTEVVVSDMIVLDSKGAGAGASAGVAAAQAGASDFDIPESALDEPQDAPADVSRAEKAPKAKAKKSDKKKDAEVEEPEAEDIPF